MKIITIKSILFFVALSIILLTQALSSESVKAQPLNIAHWTFGSMKINNSTQIIIKAKLDDHWHIFSTYHKGEIGLPTVITFEKSNDYELDGEIVEPKPVAENDELTKTTLLYFINEASFKQNIKIKSDKPFVIKGIVTYQGCNNEGCIAPIDIDFNIEIN